MALLWVPVFCFFAVTSAKGQTVLPDDYWDDVDFNDTTLIHGDELTSKLVNYLYINACVDEASFDSLSMSSLGVIFAKAKTNMRMYEFVLDFMLNGYTAMGRPAVTDYLLNYPQLSEGEITMAQGMRLDSITEPYQKVRVGAKAPDFEGVTIDGRTYRLYESQAKDIILFFWSADCEYCHDFLTDIRKKLNLKSDFELVTFALADSKEEVEATVKRMKLTGFHFFDDRRWDGKAFLDYHVTSTPTVFVLDADKTIVCKPYDWNELKAWLNNRK